MLFPKNPKVLIIDDEYDEVAGLMQTFSLKGIPYIHFNGSKIPSNFKKFTSIRLVILDIDLKGRTSGIHDDKQKASTLAKYLNEIIDEKTYPFFILFWTKNKEVSESVIRYLDESKLKTAGSIDLDKPPKDALRKMSLKKFEQKITSAISNDTLEFIIGWENAIGCKASLFSNEIAAISANESMQDVADCNKALKNILTKLVMSHLAVNQIDMSVSPSDRLKYATNEWNISFGSNLPTDFCEKLNISLPNQSKLTVNSIAHINTKMFFEERIERKSPFGGIFYEKNQELKNAIETDKIVKKLVALGNGTLIGMVLTPECDVAQNKMLSAGNKRYHRVVYGIKMEIPNTPTQEKAVLDVMKGARSDRTFPLAPFIDENGKKCVLLFHFSTLHTHCIRKKIVMQVKRILAFDIQTKAANHVNRLGNSMLEC